MASSRADITEILIQHLDFLDSKLCSIHNFVNENSKFFSFMKEKAGQNVVTFLNQCQSALSSGAKLPKMSSSMIKSLETFMPQIKKSVHSLDYVVHWARTAKNNLADIDRNCLELDIRWNYHLTLQVCTLFVQVVKICVLMHMYPHVLAIIQMIPHFSELSSIALIQPIGEILRFVTQSVRNPFGFARAQMTSFENKIVQFFAQIAPYVVEACGHWPVIDWQMFDPYSKNDQPSSDSTLPSNTVLVLENLELFRETIILFSVVFSKYFSQYPQYNSLALSVLSESSSIYLTPITKLSISKLLQMYSATQTEDVFKDSVGSIEYDKAMKESVSHKQRMSHIYYLLRDICDICSFDSNYLPMLINELLPLSSMAIYEILSSFASSNVTKEVAQIIDVLVDLGILFSNHKMIIKRFFLFNLATVDLQYLTQLNAQLGKHTDSWQVNLSKCLVQLINSLKVVDLVEFDNGYEYDFNPLVFTINRIIHLYNEISNTTQASFLHPLFEHLSVMIIHTKFYLDPLKYFLQYCPIHKLWRFSDLLAQYVKDVSSDINLHSRIVTLFSFFNLDTIGLQSLSSHFKHTTTNLESICGDLINHSNKLIHRFTQFDSPFISISQHTSTTKLFDSTNFVHNFGFFSADPFIQQTQKRSSLWQIKELFRRLPHSLTLGEKTINIASQISNSITRSIAPLLFPFPNTNSEWIDSSFTASAQLFWSLFFQLKAPFPYRLLECRYDQCCYPGQTTYLEQIAVIRNNLDLSSINEPGGIVKRRLVTTFEEYIQNFVQKGYLSTIYNTYGHRFDSISPEETNIHFVSLSSFRLIIRNLGPQVGFCLNRIIVSHISDIMVNIYQTHDKMLNTISDWWVEFRENKTSFLNVAASNPEIIKCANEFVRLGVALIAREVLRQSLSEVIDSNVPGLIELINAASRRDKGQHLGEKQYFLAEMVSGEPAYHFIKLSISKKNLMKSSNCAQFYFFLALFLLNPDWNSTKFIPESEAFTSNLHLIPVAIDAFLKLNDAFVSDSDEKKISTGVQTYFNVLSLIYQQKQKTLESQSIWLVILADLFPKRIRGIEYGIIAEHFPYSVVLESYRNQEKSTKKK